MRRHDMTITILGCGASGGVPLIGCRCATCQSTDPRNTRTRASVLVEGGGSRVLIDTAPDLRHQALRHQIRTVDAILYTHAHADHCHGLDDARAFNFHRQEAIPVYGAAEVLDELRQRFGYAFHAPAKDTAWFCPSLELQVIEDYYSFTAGNLDFLMYLQHHGWSNTHGYRVENIAYSPDVHNFPEQSLQLLDSLDVWVVDCLRYEPAPTHAHLAQTLEWIAQKKPKLAVLTHMAHELEYQALQAQLPEGVVVAYDGMRIHVSAAGDIRLSNDGDRA